MRGLLSRCDFPYGKQYGNKQKRTDLYPEIRSQFCFPLFSCAHWSRCLLTRIFCRRQICSLQVKVSTREHAATTILAVYFRVMPPPKGGDESRTLKFCAEQVDSFIFRWLE